MPGPILDAMARQGFEEVIALHDRRSNLRGFLGIHDTVRGPAFGGIRRWTYRDEREALRDCLRLARAMTHKCALADLPAGGGKLVIADHPDMDVEEAFRHIGRRVQRLQGSFYTGPDVGTSRECLGWVAAETGYVTDPGPDGPGELPDSTAAGVFRSMETALRHLDGETDWTKRVVVIQGLGEVGTRVALRLVESGAKVFASEIDGPRAHAFSEELGLELLTPGSEYDVECDVFAPCALGGILHDLTLERLRCRVVAGGANNVLARTEHGDRLHDRGILFTPDMVVSAGGLIRGALFHLEGRREPVEVIGARVAGTLQDVLERAAADGAPPARVAEREAEERIARWRGSAAR